MAIERIAVVGGTGPQGRGLAIRLAMAGYPVVVGSRDVARADAVAADVRAASPGGHVTGAVNADAVADADTVVLAIPAAGLVPLLAILHSRLAGKLVIDVTVPLGVHDGLIEHVPIAGIPSAGELVARALPECRVVAAFKNIPAAELSRVDRSLEGDVLLCGDDPAANALVAGLVARIPRLRPVDAGPMRAVRPVEAITALLVNLNRRHHARTSIRVLGLGAR